MERIFFFVDHRRRAGMARRPQSERASRGLEQENHAGIFLRVHKKEYERLLFAFLNQLRHAIRNFFVVIKLHIKVAASLRHGAQLGGITEHFRKRHFGVHHFQVADAVV